MHIREATADDAGDVSQVVDEVYIGGGWADPQRSPDYVAELLDASTRITGATVLLAEDELGSIGTVTAVQWPSHLANIARPGELEIRMLAVVPSARHQGVARALVAACENLAHGRGLAAVVLSTAPAMRAAVDLYEGLGYVRAPDRDWVINGFSLITYRRGLL